MTIKNVFIVKSVCTSDLHINNRAITKVAHRSNFLIVFICYSNLESAGSARVHLFMYDIS